MFADDAFCYSTNIVVVLLLSKVFFSLSLKEVLKISGKSRNHPYELFGQVTAIQQHWEF